MDEPHIGIVIGASRRGRLETVPAQWIHALAANRRDLTAEIVDLCDYPLPFWDEPVHPSFAATTKDTIRRWCDTMASLDGYVFVTADHHHSFSGALKNALEFSHLEFSRKPASFVGCGGAGGARAIQHLRQVAVELEIAPLCDAVHIGLNEYVAVVTKDGSLSDFDHLRAAGERLLDQLSWWSATLKAGRAGGASASPRLAGFRHRTDARRPPGDAAAL